MMRRKFAAALIGAAIWIASPVSATNVALLLSNSSYRNLPDYRNGSDINRARPELSASGISVMSAVNADARQMSNMLARFLQTTPEADGAIISLSGRFASTTQETYFLPTDAPTPSLARISASALPLSTVLAALAELPGRALLVLSSDQQTREFGPYLSLGLGPVDIPQGVTVVTGSVRAVETFLGDVVATPGRNMMPAIARSNSLRVSGYVPDNFVFLSAATPEPVDDEDELDNALWATVSELDTIEGFESYLERFPRGRYAAEARAGIARIQNDPVVRAEKNEAALNLTSDDRRAIQSDLTLLEYEPRGIDGIFGPGSRGAIRAWQEDQGFAATGFLNRRQIQRLASLADERARVLEEEAAKRAAQESERDRAFWAQTGALGDEAGYRAYLEEYPDGRFSELANARLRVIEREKRNNVSAVERLFWEQALEAGTIEGYRRYLDQFPRGAFAEDARSRIAALEAASAQNPAVAAAERAEAALNLNKATRRTIESRLNALGLKPGRVDGDFTDETRRAIRRYQSARKLQRTGYLNEATVVRLFADTVISIFD